MPDVKSRRDRYATITRASVLVGARDLFIERGFEATSVDEIARAAEVSKGAVYHHFTDKKDIFAKLLADVQESVMAVVIAAADGPGTTGERAAAAVHAFLENYGTNGQARAILRQAPAVLSRDTIREIDEQLALPFVRGLLEQLRSDDQLQAVSVEATARMLFGLLCEATSLVAESDDPIHAAAEIEAVILHMFAGLLKPTG